MQKNVYKTRWSVKSLVFIALLVAMHLVLTRVLAIEVGANRISLGSVCTILAGLWMGPAAGAVCGLAADLLGCLMKGYAVNPLITLAAMAWGVIPALMRPLFANRTKVGKMAGIVCSVFAAAVVSSLVLNTAGLVLLMGYNFYAVMPGRLLQFVVMIPIYCVVTCALYFSPLTNLIVGSIAPPVMQKKTV